MYRYRTMPMMQYKPQCRKEGNISPMYSAVPFILWLVLLFASFCFSGLFVSRMFVMSYPYLFSEFTTQLSSAYIYSTVILSAMEVCLLYLYIAFYNMLARRLMRGDIPCGTSELFKNLVPFFILRNVICGALSLLMFSESGIFVSIGMASFDTIATMIVFFPAFYAIKNRYVKDGYGKELIDAYAVPYLIVQAVYLIF